MKPGGSHFSMWPPYYPFIAPQTTTSLVIGYGPVNRAARRRRLFGRGNIRRWL